MTITLIYDNGEDKNSSRYACTSRLIEMENFDKEKYEQIQKGFIEQVEKMENHGLEILSAENTVLEKEMD